MDALKSYREKTSLFCKEVLKQVCIDKFSPKYQQYVDDAIWKYLYGDILAQSLGELTDLPKYKLLDIGAGSGGISTAFAKKQCKVTAIDVDEGYQRLSKIGYYENGVNVDSNLFDGTRYPFPSEEFEMLCCSNIYEHVPDVNIMFQEMFRGLKDKGIIFARMDYKWSWKNIKNDPHYGVFGVILLPRWLRSFIIVRLLKIVPILEGYTWAPSFRGVSILAKKHGFYSYKCNENILFVKETCSKKLKLGSGNISFNNPFCIFKNWHQVENWGDEQVRWSKENAFIRIPILGEFHCIDFETYSHVEKRCIINGFNYVIGTQWKKIKILKCTNGHWLDIKISTKGSFADGDFRKLGIAVKLIHLL